jgi:hypothetical protein
VPIQSIELMDPAVIHTERTARLAITAQLEGCDDLAMPQLAVEVPDVIVGVQAWRPTDGCAEPPRSVRRPLALRFPAAGTWTVHADGDAADPLTVDVQAPPRACEPSGSGFDCELDCDCPGGELCLGGNGFAGPFTQCARPCELDRDCAGDGRCVSIPDGLEFHCEASFPECDGATLCPAGYACQAGACMPEFLLGAATRVTCACDADCAPGLRCAEAQLPDRERRCEVLCPTSSAAWCSAQHFCGAASQDTAGLAPADSVCVWAGE